MLITIFLSALLRASMAFSHCKCTPTDACWPSSASWKSLNESVDGKLIRNQPIAASCYPGTGYDSHSCQQVSRDWTNSSLIAAQPIGYSYPLLNACPPINTTVSAYPECDLGAGPAYTVNATRAEHVSAGIKFAKDNNLRLVVKNTGHDIIGRSQGYGSLMIWIKYIQDGIELQERYMPTAECASNWTGSAFAIHGGYVWKDVYSAAAKHGLRVVGGNDLTVGVIGGYLQGGGHSPSSHDYGLGADQVLEMTAVLASGEVVLANACRNSDLFTALRGGGGGTYGIVISATIKAYSTAPILSHSLQIVPLTENLTSLVDIVTMILTKYPSVSGAGFSGYGAVGQAKLISPSTDAAGAYVHTLGKKVTGNDSAASIANAKSVLNDALLKDLLPYNGSSLVIRSTWQTYPDFSEYYNNVETPAAVGASDLSMTSRLFDKPSLSNSTNINGMLRTIFSKPNTTAVDMDGLLLDLMLIGGGQVLHAEPYTSINPVWRKTYLLTELLSLWPGGTDSQTVKKIKEDATFRKAGAMEAATPGMGTYLNEADRDDPMWKGNYFGEMYDWLRVVKGKYDPHDTFYCWRCVGSEDWQELAGSDGQGPLCRYPRPRSSARG